MYSWQCLACLVLMSVVFCFFFQAEDGIRDLVRSRGLGDVYERQCWASATRTSPARSPTTSAASTAGRPESSIHSLLSCLLYTSDAADDLLCVDLGGRRNIQKKKNNTHSAQSTLT